MVKDIGNDVRPRRIAINACAGFVPGINAVIKGATLSACKMGWEVLGVAGGFEGLLYPEKFPDGGLITLSQQMVENLDASAFGILGKSARMEPFLFRNINEISMAEKNDESNILLEKLRENNIDALISVVGRKGLNFIHKINQKGFNTVGIPGSIENDIAATSVSLGFNTALSFTIDLLNRAYQTARSSCRIAVVEVHGNQAGWLALQGAIAVCADAVLIPEIPIDIRNLASAINEKVSAKRPYGLVVVSEGAMEISTTKTGEEVKPLKTSLSSAASGYSGEPVIKRSGEAAETIARELQLMIMEETLPMAIGPWVHNGIPTTTDLQLGIAYGSGAVQALNAGKTGSMVSIVPPEIQFVPLSEAISKIRTVPDDSELLKIASSLGIYSGK